MLLDKLTSGVHKVLSYDSMFTIAKSLGGFHSRLPDIVTDYIQVLLASIQIVDSNPKQDVGWQNDVMMYQVVAHALVNLFNGDIKLATAWYTKATQEEIDQIRVLVALDEDTLKYFK